MDTAVEGLVTQVQQRRKVGALLASGQARRLREQAGLTQGEVGAAVGVRASAVARWESGDRVPHRDRLSRYAALLERLAEVGP
jgi:transcriptional regulator with XRE-family HTH domain